MTSSSASNCKVALLRRCVRAVILSVAVQFLLLTVFLLFVNFELFHPLRWVMSTFGLVCSFYTWFASIPLILAVAFYGLTLSQQHFAERRYSSSRYRWLISNGPRKALFLVAHLFVGYLTAWLYTGYLHADYRQFVYRCYGQDCLSSNHVFLLGMGLTAGCYNFVSQHMRQEVSVDYMILDLSPRKRLRQTVYATVRQVPMKTLLPTLSYSIVFILCGFTVKSRLSQLLHVDMDDRLMGIMDIFGSPRLVFYAWLLTAQILCNMHLIQLFFSILLADKLKLVVARNRINRNADKEMTIAAALSSTNTHVEQCLAAHFFYREAKRKDSAVRQEIFQLTEPGNHPANWRGICDQSLCLIGSFTDDITESLKQISNVINTNEQSFSTVTSDINAALLAEKVLLRQYNQLHGIRSAVTSPSKDYDQQWDVKRTNNVSKWCENVSAQLETSVQRLFRRIPGVEYLFSEPEGARTLHLIENSLALAMVTQALAHVCVASLTEDQYGVVQDDLPAIIKALHRLKCTLDKIGTLKANSSNFTYLRNAVRRSLYNICNSFYEYLEEIIPSSEEQRQLKFFVNNG